MVHRRRRPSADANEGARCGAGVGQIGALERPKLVARESSLTDGRVRLVVVTEPGRDVIQAPDAARGRLASDVLPDWSKRDLDESVRLTRRLVDDLMRLPD